VSEEGLKVIPLFLPSITAVSKNCPYINNSQTKKKRRQEREIKDTKKPHQQQS